MNTAEQLEATPDKIAAEVHRRLRFWGIWRYREDNPCIGHDPVNIIGKLMARRKLEWEGETYVPPDWTEAELTNIAVRVVGCIAPDCYHALMVRYAFMPEFDGDRKKWDVAEFRRRLGRDVSPMKYRADVANGRRLVAARLIA